jgi:hypothetical protein
MLSATETCPAGRCMSKSTSGKITYLGGQNLSERLLLSELKATLHRWGDWIERHSHDSGLPTQVAFLNIPTPTTGHRILCAEMPRKVAALHRAIIRLEQDQQRALDLWYAWQHRTPPARLLGSPGAHGAAELVGCLGPPILRPLLPAPAHQPALHADPDPLQLVDSSGQSHAAIAPKRHQGRQGPFLEMAEYPVGLSHALPLERLMRS